VGPPDSLAAVTPLSRAEAALRRIVVDLQQLARRFAVIGGLAVSSRTEPRFTRDADLAVVVTDDRDAERVIRDLSVRHWRVVAVVEQDAAARLATVRLAGDNGDDDGVVIDLLFASSEIEAEIVGAAEWVDVVAGLRIPVARIGHLIALKVLARDDRTRPQDRVDLAALLGVADAGALDEARAALDLITRRGFHRGRDLIPALDAARQEFGR
jgi:hypothetical protein